ncbi:MAG TPA: DUF5670 family protein [Gemmatimonadaceae bacterium]
MAGILWTIVVVLFVLWLLGIVFHVAIWLAWVLLCVAIVIAIVRLITGRSAV